MHKPILIAIAVMIVFIIIAHLCKCACGCGCWKWCECVKSTLSNCCCKLVTTMAPAVASTSTQTENFAAKNRTVTLHYAPWCVHCKIMKPIWEQVKIATAGSGIVFKEVDEDKAKTPGITGYPTILMVDGSSTYKYPGQPDFETLRDWVVSPTR